MARVYIKDHNVTEVDDDAMLGFSQITLDPLSLENCLKMSYSGKIPQDPAAQGGQRTLHDFAQGPVSRVVLHLARVSRAMRRFCCGVGMVDTIRCKNTAINLIALGHYFSYRHIAKRLDDENVSEETHNR